MTVVHFTRVPPHEKKNLFRPFARYLPNTQHCDVALHSFVCCVFHVGFARNKSVRRKLFPTRFERTKLYFINRLTIYILPRNNHLMLKARKGETKKKAIVRFRRDEPLLLATYTVRVSMRLA